MLSANEFDKKQLVFVFANHGEKLSFSNDNLIVKDEDGKVKHQSTCYRILALFVVGNITITSGLILRSRKFCFPIVLMNQNLRVYGSFGFEAEGNTILRARQYEYNSLDAACHLVSNKVANQQAVLRKQRQRNDTVNETIGALDRYLESIKKAQNVHELMGFEGAAAKLYFTANFNNCDWAGRKPRAKLDYVNATLDIGYTLLFNYIESLLRLFGFDVYVGVLHKQFYMRKSLVCDLVEPFRPLIDWQVRKSISLGQCKAADFTCDNGSWSLPWNMNKDYVLFLLKPILDNKHSMFLYVRDYYRSFAQCRSVDEYPWFKA